MKKKLMRMPKVVTILVAVLIVAIFLGSMDVAAFFLADTVSLPGYGSSMIAEFMAGVVAFLLLCLFGYFGVLGEKGKGNPVFCCNHVSDRMDGGTYFPRCDPESVSGTFFQNEKRDSLGGHSQWCIVRGGTFDKYFTGSDGDKCDDPGDHFASLMGSGIFGTGTTVEQINQMSAANLIAVPVLLIPCIVLLRPKKLLEMEQEANHIVVFETFEEADRNAALSLALGMISILTGFMGYGLGIGIAGLIGGRLSRKVQPEKNGMALAGMILSGIGMAVSIIGMIVLCFVYSNLNGLSAVMMMNGVK